MLSPLQVPVRRPAHLETTSAGAALAAGIGAGLWTSEEAFSDLKHGTGEGGHRAQRRGAAVSPVSLSSRAYALCVHTCGAGGTLFEPRITAAAASRRHAKWQLAVQRSFALAELTKDLQD